MTRMSWKSTSLEECNKAVKLEQVLHLAEEMFDALADRLRKKVEDQQPAK